MDYEEVTKPGLAIWVEELSILKSHELIWKGTGTAIDGNHGFGDPIVRQYSGEALIISERDRIRTSLSVGEAHFSRGGFAYIIGEIDSLPSPPFLISRDVDLCKIFDGYVRIKTEPDISLTECKHKHYSLGSKDWFGISMPAQGNKLHLIAFSSRKEAKVCEGDELWTFDWDCPAGTIQCVF